MRGSVWNCGRAARLIGLLSLTTLAGCYDAGALKETRQDEATVTKLAEVDLGTYHITLPLATGDTGGGVVDFHAFGRVSHGDSAAVAQAVEERRAELRSHMLLAIRSVTNEELEEPKLGALRVEITKVINAALDKTAHVKNVGFYSFSFTEL
jgi:flagellar basal body-associated protein FliL